MRDEAHGRQVCFEFWNTINCQLCVHCQFSLLGVSLVCLYCNSAALLQWNSCESLYLCSHDRLNLTRMVPCMILLISTPPVLCTTLYCIYTYPSLTTSVELKELRLIICVHTNNIQNMMWGEWFFNIHYGMWLTCPLEQDVSAPDLLPLQNIHNLFCTYLQQRQTYYVYHATCFMFCVLKHSFPIPRDVYTTMLFGLPRVPLSWQIHEISHCHGNCPMISIQKSWHAVDQPYKQTAFNQAAWNCLCILQCSTVLIGARGDKVTSANLHWVCPHSSQCEGWFKVWVSIRVCWRSPSLLQCVATHSQLWGLD